MNIDFMDGDEVVLRSLLERNALEAPSEPCILFEDGTSWSRLDCVHEAYAAANELRNAGVTQGSVVAVALPNGPDYLRAWWGTSVLGASMVPVNPSYRGTLISHLIKLASPFVFISKADFRRRLLDIGAESTITLLDPSDLRGANKSAPSLERPIQPWDSVCLAMTSGTTGPSKLVRVSQAQCLQGGTSVFDLWGRASSDVYLCDVPSFHMGGIYAIHASLANRNKVAVRSRPDLANYWEVARDTGATFSQIYSSMVTYLDSQPMRGTERSHRLRMALTLPFPPNPDEWRRKFGIEHLLIGWGSTETGAPIAMQPGFELPPGSTGRTLPHYQVKIVDENDIELPNGVAGEAIIRCDVPWLITTEYINNPMETVKAWRNGWFHTGDLMHRDHEGNFFFVDRLKDSVRRRGQNISSYEVEVVVCAFAGIAEAAVVPERNSVEPEDEVKVWIVPETGAAIDFETLVYFCAERLPHFMVPRFFELATELPKTPSAKVQKHLLRERGSGDRTWDRAANGLDVTRHGVIHLGERTVTVTE